MRTNDKASDRGSVGRYAPTIASPIRIVRGSTRSSLSSAGGANAIRNRDRFEVSIGLFDAQRSSRAKLADRRLSTGYAMALNEDLVAPFFRGCMNFERFAASGRCMEAAVDF
ncbi:hypothetical protein BCAR13_710152 [Paraburkholderia caribensis]|nr:hypothetical protein BCAR13_710152 [Paraburkholderia caribensis]